MVAGWALSIQVFLVVVLCACVYSQCTTHCTKINGDCSFSVAELQSAIDNLEQRTHELVQKAKEDLRQVGSVLT